jgi:AraC-like DNA-binding protein
MTARNPYSESLYRCQSLARRLHDPSNYLEGVKGILRVLPENVLQFHRHNARYISKGRPFLHHRFVLMTCLREAGCIVVDGTIYRIKPGQGFLVFPYQSHYFTRPENPEQLSWLFTTFEYSAPGSLELLRDMPLVFNVQDLQRLGQTTVAFLQNGRATKGITLDVPLELAFLLSGLLVRYQQQSTLCRCKIKPDSAQILFLNPLFKHINQNLGSRIPMKDLAQCVHLSTSHLQARFKHMLGIGIGEFIRNTRVHRACVLLKGTDLSVTQVADKCGFASVYAFSRTFRCVIGAPPSVFRQG